MILNSALGAVIHVPADQPTIQAGISAASDYDTVLVADGTYTGSGNRDIRFYGKSVKLISENGPEVTIIDCQADPSDQHRGIYFDGHETRDALIQGFTVTGASKVDGGGICCFQSSPTIRRCVLTGNSEEAIRVFADCNPLIDSVEIVDNDGWGLFISGSELTLVNSSIHDGRSGIWCYMSGPLIIENCQFIDNEGGGGGAIEAWAEVSLYLSDCLFDGNVATHSYIGGVNMEHGDTLIMQNCTFRNSCGDWYYAVFAAGCYFEASRCIFEMNYCNPGQSLIYLMDGSTGASLSNCSFTNNIAIPFASEDMGVVEIDSCVFVDNQSSYGTANFASNTDPVITNCTFVRGRIFNHVSAISCWDNNSATIENTVIANTAYESPLYSDVIPSIECCNFYGNQGGDWIGNYAHLLGVNGNICSDPMFCDIFNDNCTVHETSPLLPENNVCSELISALGWGCTTWLCGDCDSSEAVDIDDAVFLITYIFAGGPPPDPIEVGDADCSGGIDIDDVVFLIMYIFAAGPEPCAPCDE
jgi:hypothetical protein